ncbi:glycosyltransferase family 2 protein [Variovorax sp. J22P271]|uniref:glycosyltransferase family 2 protein n=1 Tax=Variovorax davisae TaxID=3053515 RepID=UPI002577CA53|nr:glycosyltransferase family 2 protein [Variovorax sp. J22P271]MDM0033306.1 glycosyltransferase family 2 protein [Variovorax sp. J22P271]
MTSLHSLTIVAPVYNEEAVIGQFHARTMAVADALQGVDTQIVYVVDRGTDRTLDVLRSIALEDSRVTVLALSARFGHQMSLLAGIENSLDSDAIVMMDSDLQHPPELIPILLERFAEGVDVVYTVRAETRGISWTRAKAGELFYKLMNALSSVPIRKNAADFRLISKRVANILAGDFSERNMFLRGIFSWIGFKQVGVEYVADERAAGHSKYSLSRTLRFALTGILSFSTKPLQLGIIVGAWTGGAGFLLMFAAVVSYFIDRSIPSGWTTVVVLLLFFSAIQLFVIGIIGMYIGDLYLEMKGRPRYILDEKINHGKDKS